MNNENKNASRKASAFDIAIVAVFCAFIFLGGILTVVLPDRDFSENENTTLTTLSDVFSGNVAKKLFSGELFDMAGDFFRHQFPLRDSMLEIRALADVLLVRYETGGVIYGAEGYLIPREDNASTAFVGANAESIDALCTALENEGVDALFALVPRPCDVLQKYYPSAYNAEPLEKVRDIVFDAAPTLDLAPVLKNAVDKGEYVYYKTDHHWTTYGAYLAYCEIMKEYGETPVPLDEFERETVSTEFYGTSHSTVMSPTVKPDTVEYFHLKSDRKFTTEIVNSGVTFEGFYDRSYLEKKDKYSSFMGGNYGLVRVTMNGGENREKLVLVKDSYANSMIPFLAVHYDLVVVDPRFYRESVYELAVSEGASKLLVLCGTDGLTDANTYLVLNFGIPKE